MRDQLIRASNQILSYLPQKRYFLPSNYTSNFFPTFYKDTQEMAFAFQREVYLIAQKIIKEKKFSTVMDIGCGYGLKLKEYIAPVASDIIGVDVSEPIAYCKKTHTFGQFFVDDIQSPTLILGKNVELIICSDVIEHLKSPDNLFAYFRRFCDAHTVIVLSTPDRDAVRGEGHLGPPPNPSHVREWNMKELALYATSQGMKIVKHILVDDGAGKKTDTPTRKHGKTCQVIVGTMS